MTKLQMEYHRLNEDMRHNRAVEDENKRANIAKESENYRSNVARETETHRANRAGEMFKNYKQVQDYTTNMMSATGSILRGLGSIL